MLNFPSWKVGLIAVTLLWGMLLAMPNLFSDGFLGIEPRDTGSQDPQEIAAYQAQLQAAEESWWPGVLPDGKLNLGLDLQGGVYLLMEIDPDEVANNRLEVILRDITAAFRQLSGQPQIVMA
ncbi:MAG: protein translocase subunit SecD, partial [Pseudomonadota bacterium]